MKEEYLIFKEFNDIEVASHIAELLKNNHIDTVIENNKETSSVWGTNNFNNDIKLKITSKNFITAQSIIENYYKELVRSAPEDYYLFQLVCLIPSS